MIWILGVEGITDGWYVPNAEYVDMTARRNAWRERWNANRCALTFDNVARICAAEERIRELGETP